MAYKLTLKVNGRIGDGKIWGFGGSRVPGPLNISFETDCPLLILNY
jgi:hypothetical protein